MNKGDNPPLILTVQYIVIINMIASTIELSERDCALVESHSPIPSTAANGKC